MHGRDDDGVLAGQAGRTGEGELQVGEPAALTEPGSVLAGCYAACDGHIDRRKLRYGHPAGGHVHILHQTRLAPDPARLPQWPYCVAMGATTAFVARTRSPGESSISSPRLPPLQNTVAKFSADESITTGRRLRWPTGAMPPAT